MSVCTMPKIHITAKTSQKTKFTF